MTTYIPTTQSPTAPSPAAPSLTAPSGPVASLASADSLFSLWMLPLTLTQTWLSAWPGSDGSDAERLLDAGTGEQIPVPPPIQESKDANVFA